MATDIADIEVIPLSEACGAEIRGVDLTKPLDGKTLRSIEQAWYDHLVIVFRDQDISNEDQVHFCRYFGDLEDVRTGKFANEEMRHTMMITNVTDTGFQTALENGDMWFHSDQCYYEFPLPGLHAICHRDSQGGRQYAVRKLLCRMGNTTCQLAGKIGWSESP